MTTTVATVDVTDYYFSSDNFCAFSCHVMENTVYKEMQQSKHWKTPSGVRPKCADCHVSGRLTFAMWDHFVGTGELFVWAANDFSNPEAFEVLRPAAAERSRSAVAAVSALAAAAASRSRRLASLASALA